MHKFFLTNLFSHHRYRSLGNFLAAGFSLVFDEVNIYAGYAAVGIPAVVHRLAPELQASPSVVNVEGVTLYFLRLAELRLKVVVDAVAVGSEAVGDIKH